MSPKYGMRIGKMFVATNAATFAQISHLTAGVMGPGPNEYDKPEGRG